MPSVDSARGGGGATVWRHQAAAPVAVAPGLAPPGCSARGGGARFGAARRLLALELQVGGEAHRVGAVFFHRFLVTGGKIGVVFIAGARGVVDVI